MQRIWKNSHRLHKPSKTLSSGPNQNDSVAVAVVAGIVAAVFLAQAVKNIAYRIIPILFGIWLASSVVLSLIHI